MTSSLDVPEIQLSRPRNTQDTPEPAQYPVRFIHPRLRPAFNGGPSNCSAKPGRLLASSLQPCPLQWRAEQLLGQTRRRWRRAGAGARPSMEGRAIARPNENLRGEALRPRSPSMEGRAIARPNAEKLTLVSLTSPTFNGGPSNCSAKRDSPLVRRRRSWTPSMEGRAIARPNYASPSSLLHDLDSLPSMEGRAIARPNADGEGGGVDASPPSMEGRAIARPNRRVHHGRVLVRGPSMEGRAIARPNRPLPGPNGRGSLTFNGGPSNCSAKLELLGPKPAAAQPSMEGRAIARPNRGHVGKCRTVVAGLQWRAEQLLGQTHHRP